MRKKLGLVDLIMSIKTLVETNTGLKCYDAVPLNAPSPFYFAEVTRKRAADSKTMYRETYTVWIHAIAEPTDNGSSVQIYEMIQDLEESLTEDITLPDGYEVILQTTNGVQTIQTDETKEKHAVIEFDFMVAYGFKCKI